jgi:hypothetical protein
MPANDQFSIEKRIGGQWRFWIPVDSTGFLSRVVNAKSAEGIPIASHR